MASNLKNLSESKGLPLIDTKGKQIAIITADWNEKITHSMRDAATQCFVDYGFHSDQISHYSVPGAFELPLAAKLILKQKAYDTILCIGCVIKGETKHDEYISNAVAQGIMNLGLASSIPIIFGVLTPNDEQQAIDRAGGRHGNKGVEAAHSALHMLALKSGIQQSKNPIGFGS